ncbi:diacylglycerol kinase [Streptomyces armeniacus]|uniref:Diacylglycerol kinase n=1 Tax=Streptomyces armeniacus TaxID=83291 RepID=A0A345XKN6_9ACTN|nr:diacylglycerol kinase [Streptomyces armeniacus]AXK32202.1 diacylglycerol kinase [Streptomyces armeniacus]
MTSEITLFVNPAAGRGRGARAAQPAAAALRDAGYAVRTVVGNDADDALVRARTAVEGGTGALIAVGGDGMASLALQAVAGTDVPLGVVAVGTGNDFARATGLPVRDPAEAGRVIAEALKAGHGTSVDLGRVGPAGGSEDSGGSGGDGRWFGSVLASGFDSRVNDRGNRLKWPTGRFRYDLAILVELAALRPIPYRITLDDGEPQEIEATLVAVGNGPSYGGGMRICTDARMDDGLFDITVVGECSRTTLLRVFPRVYKGTHLSHPAVTVHRARKVTLEADGLTGYADGEPVGPLPLTAESVPGVARVLTPGPR